jgi:hypothetical protein
LITSSLTPDNLSKMTARVPPLTSYSEACARLTATAPGTTQRKRDVGKAMAVVVVVVVVLLVLVEMWNGRGRRVVMELSAWRLHRRKVRAPIRAGLVMGR